MKLESKYESGDKVFLARLKRTEQHEDCPLCDRRGKVEAAIEGYGITTITCPECSGEGQNENYKVIYETVVIELTVEAIESYSRLKGFAYICKEVNQLFNESELYNSKKDAEKRAKELKEINEGIIV